MTNKAAPCLACIFLISLWGQADVGAKREPQAFEFEKNALVHGDFEAGLKHPWGTGAHSKGKAIWWNSASCRSSARISAKTSKSPNASLFIHNPSPRAPHVYGTTAQKILINPRRRYRLVVWASARDLASPGAVSFCVDPEWRVRPVNLPAGSFPWTQFDGMFTLPGDSAEIRILSEDKGAVWLDDIKVIPDLVMDIHTHSGSAWSGRDGEGWDFVLYQPRSPGKDHLSFKYAAQHSRSGCIRMGKMEVSLFGRHLKAELLDERGRVRRGYDGTISEDGALVWGSCWPLPDSSSAGPSRYGWWATIERKLPFPIPSTLALNLASVAQLEAAGLSGRSARTLVEGRELGMPYRSIAEAAKAPGLMKEERKILEECCFVE